MGPRGARKGFVYFRRDSGPAFAWHGPESLGITPADGVTGNPVLIQSRFGSQGNFELVSPVFGGGLAHFWRNNDDLDHRWSEPTLFGAELDGIEGVTLIQVISATRAISSDLQRRNTAVPRISLYQFWRDSGPSIHGTDRFPCRSAPPGGASALR